MRISDWRSDVCSSDLTIIELFPLRSGALDRPNLPRAGPLLHRLLPLDRPLDLFMGLDIDQAGDAISLGEAGAVALPVFPDAAGDVVGDGNVKRPVLAAGKDIDVVGHRLALGPMGPGNEIGSENV